ncbi:hypothetical protein GTP44_07280 [Duganella sp. FT50W]|uniref:DUF3617 family protein n=1 Tax=Duganella lactea TaxID=2692173 RepID=A0A6L8MFL0_9BURK|nr:STY0301 family protein [Duganella lactea]MYM81760.1 hypothetical protein [Duganella lactea]
MFIKRLMFASLIVSPMLVSAATVQCPAFIPASAIQLSDTQAGWVPYVASPLYLHAAAPMSGPPEMKGDLADFKESRSKKEWSYTYALEGTFPQGKWLQCTYGERNQVTLSRRLPDDTQECKFTYRKGAKAGQHDITTLCR